MRLSSCTKNKRSRSSYLILIESSLSHSSERRRRRQQRCGRGKTRFPFQKRSSTHSINKSSEEGGAQWKSIEAPCYSHCVYLIRHEKASSNPCSPNKQASVHAFAFVVYRLEQQSSDEGRGKDTVSLPRQRSAQTSPVDQHVCLLSA